LKKGTIELLEPRKTPRQARSTASVQAILEATVQVLLKDGKSVLTTTRVAERAGVSVGTLYQYFPNKNSLLQAVLKEHLDQVAAAMETACGAVHGASLSTMAETITSVFLAAKFRHLDASTVLYAISEDVEGRRIARMMHARVTKAMGEMFKTAGLAPTCDPVMLSSTLLSAMAGVSRLMLESGLPRTSLVAMQQELRVMVRAYLEASAKKPRNTSV
jgi:AcrR family transcriptional regulator